MAIHPTRTALLAAATSLACAACDLTAVIDPPDLNLPTNLPTWDAGLDFDALPATGEPDQHEIVELVDASTQEPESVPDCAGDDCPCPDGFGRSEHGCVDLDECQANNGGCGPLAVCVNERGAPPSCRCPDGRVDVNGDGSVCLGTLAVSVGEAHVCAISEERDLFCWGDNTHGQLGDGTRTARFTPKRVALHGDWTEIAAGGSHTCGIRGRSVYCWGASGLIGQPEGAHNTYRPMRAGPEGDWTEIAAGDSSACAIAGGRLYCWGEDVSATRPGDDPTVPVPIAYEPKPITSGSAGDWSGISAGQRHYCGLRGGIPVCFGDALDPEVVGTGDTIDSAFRVLGDHDAWDAISAGANKVCALRDGELYCWGQGALGNGVLETLRRPTRIGTHSDWTAISAGHTSCGLRGGAVYCWGQKTGRADGVREQALRPTRIGGDDDWLAVDAQGGTMCGLRGMGLYCWGDDTRGLLARGTDSSVNTPTRVGDGSDYSMIRTGSLTCGRRANGLYCWGARFAGAPDVNSPEHAYDPEPERIEGPLSWQAVSSYGSGACGLREGALLCWGYFPPESVLAPREVTSRLGWTSVAKGDEHACSVANGELHCWGYNDLGQLGDPALSSRVSTPRRIGSSSGWMGLTAGAQHTCGIRSGELYCWGTPWLGQSLGTETPSPNVPSRVGTASDWSMVSTSNTHTCGLRGGDLYCWGKNTFGQLGVGDTEHRDQPTLLSSGWSLVSAGDGHTCALREGSVYCWGDNRSGQLGDGRRAIRELAPSRLGGDPGWTDVSAHGSTTCGVYDGHAYCWGDNTLGQAGAPLPWSDEPLPIAFQ